MLVDKILLFLLVVAGTAVAGFYILVVAPRREREAAAKRNAELARQEDEEFRAIAEQELEECGIHLNPSEKDQD